MFNFGAHSKESKKTYPDSYYELAPQLRKTGEDDTGGSDVCNSGVAWVRQNDQSGGRERDRGDFVYVLFMFFMEFTAQGGQYQEYLVTALLHINPKRILSTKHKGCRWICNTQSRTQE